MALKEFYGERPTALDDGLALIFEDVQTAMIHGVPVTHQGQEHRLRLAVVGVKGDWPWLIESAHFERHFRRAPKQSSSSMDCPGICHLCMAGFANVPFEDFSEDPKWVSTMGSAAAASPWSSLSPWYGLPSLRSFRPFTWRPDVFHNFHLGHGRYFLSSALVVLQLLEEGGGVEARFQSLTRKWLQFCRLRKAFWLRSVADACWEMVRQEAIPQMHSI